MRVLSLFLPVFIGFAACSAPDSSEETTESSSELGATSAAPAQAELDFQPGWVQVQRGAIVQGGHVTVVRANARLVKCSGATVFSYARFLPGGQAFSSDESFSFDVPAGAKSVQLWFHAVAPGCDEWDSNYGANFSFPVVATAPANIGWAGDWGSSISRDCQHTAGVPEPITIDEYMRERACIFVDIDVWVPGVTDVAGAHPEWIQATVDWSKDGKAPVTEWLAFQGIVGHNARFRWTVPYEIRNVADWTTVTYAFGLKSDGVHTAREALPSGAARTIIRAFSL